MTDLTYSELDKQLEFAKSINDDSLQQCLDRLKKTEEISKTEVRITTDFAPRSFYFIRMFNGKFTGNGGIIWHGQHDGFGSGQAPTYSVSLEKTSGWQIHT